MHTMLKYTSALQVRNNLHMQSAIITTVTIIQLEIHESLIVPLIT
jgi:hypothetical protein